MDLPIDPYTSGVPGYFPSPQPLGVRTVSFGDVVPCLRIVLRLHLTPVTPDRAFPSVLYSDLPRRSQSGVSTLVSKRDLWLKRLLTPPLRPHHPLDFRRRGGLVFYLRKGLLPV